MKDKALHFIHSTDFLKLFINDKISSGEINGIRLCTLNMASLGDDLCLSEYSYIEKRIGECIPKSMFEMPWEVCTWIYTGTAIVTSYAKGFSANPYNKVKDVANVVTKQAELNTVTAFEISLGNIDAVKWLFVVV